MGEADKVSADLVQVARLAVEGKQDDLRLYLARLVRRYRSADAGLSSDLARLLQGEGKTSGRSDAVRSPVVSLSGESAGLSVLKPAETDLIPQLILPETLVDQLEGLLSEWEHAGALRARGLDPISSAVFVGPPGVGKTQTARWLAARLGLPLFALDLTAVMSSRLGQSGANLRAALDFARAQPSVLFLDEIDSIAKSRGDDSDVGELKRLVTILLQELDNWPSTSLLLAATNHPELVDRALWRRFDLEIEFPMPTADEVLQAVDLFLGPDAADFSDFLPAIALLLEGSSYSDIQRATNALRRSHALSRGTAEQIVAGLVGRQSAALPRSQRIQLAVDLEKKTGMSQHQISRLTSVSRDTLRSHKKTATAGDQLGWELSHRSG